MPLFFNRHPEAHRLKPYATRIFRELPTQLAMSKLIDYRQPANVKILGASDGSEVYAYAIAMAEASKGRAKENVHILAVDKEP